MLTCTTEEKVVGRILKGNSIILNSEMDIKVVVGSNMLSGEMAR